MRKGEREGTRIALSASVNAQGCCFSVFTFQKWNTKYIYIFDMKPQFTVAMWNPGPWLRLVKNLPLIISLIKPCHWANVNTTWRGLWYNWGREAPDNLITAECPLIRLMGRGAVERLKTSRLHEHLDGSPALSTSESWEAEGPAGPPGFEAQRTHKLPSEPPRKVAEQTCRGSAWYSNGYDIT